MKKCPYCAEEIQDEAIFCRYCHHDLGKEKGKKVSVPSSHTKRRSVFLPALLFGLGAGAIVTMIRYNRPIENPSLGIQGHLNHAVLGGISTVIIFGLLYALVVWIWRGLIKRSAGIKAFSEQTGFSTLAFFSVLLVVWFAFLMSSTDGKLLADTRQTLVALGMNQPTPTPKKKTTAPTKVATATAEPPGQDYDYFNTVVAKTQENFALKIANSDRKAVTDLFTSYKKALAERDAPLFIGLFHSAALSDANKESIRQFFTNYEISVGNADLSHITKTDENISGRVVVAYVTYCKKDHCQAHPNLGGIGTMEFALENGEWKIASIPFTNFP